MKNVPINESEWHIKNLLSAFSLSNFKLRNKTKILPFFFKSLIVFLGVIFLLPTLNASGQTCPNGTSMVMVDVSLNPLRSQLHVFPWSNGNIGTEASCTFGNVVPEEGMAYNATNHRFYFIGASDHKLYVYNGITKSIESSFNVPWPSGVAGRTWQGYCRQTEIFSILLETMDCLKFRFLMDQLQPT